VKANKPMKTITNRMYLALALFTLACFMFAPAARAVTPAPDGGYPGQNTAEGEDALFSLTSGGGNTAVGFKALFSNTTGAGNTASGYQALFSNTIGNSNTAKGGFALFSNTTGGNNTANGYGALSGNTTGFLNTANGAYALDQNQRGSQNTANGSYALSNNISGSNNTANGTDALGNNSTGSANTATGYRALVLNNGDNNTATGFNAMFDNVGGINNTAHGAFALIRNTSGNNNIAVGYNAGGKLTGSNNIDIGNPGLQGDSNFIRIGTEGLHTGTFVAGILGSAVNGRPVVVNPNGRLGVTPSSARFKQQIKPMEETSDVIYKLSPVTFRYKHELDPEGIPQFGLVAEQVEKVNPDLVARDDQGKPYTVRYDAVNAMLLNEFLKEHKRVREQARDLQEQKAINAELRSALAAVSKRLKEQDAKIDKVSAQVELSEPAPRTVLNTQ
jgi:hypothetical protein